MRAHTLARTLLLLTVIVKDAIAQIYRVEGLNPGQVPLATRQSWCESETRTCAQVCSATGQRVEDEGNTCDYNQLTCLCECRDGSFPAVSQFSNSLGSLACNWQLNQCLTNTTSLANQDSCLYTFICGGQDPAEVPSLSSSASTQPLSSTSIPASTSTSATSATTSDLDRLRQSSESQPSTNYAWIAAPICGALLVIVVVPSGLWWLKRRKRKESEETSRASSVEQLWNKAELDGSPKQMAEADGHSRAYQLPSGHYESHSELEGNQQQPVELDGSNPLPQELRSVSERLTRTNALRSPSAPSSPYSWSGEQSTAASTISSRMY